MERKDAPSRVITLNTLYHSDTTDIEHVLVITYKTDPKGEEFYGGHSVLQHYNLDELFVNRVLTLVGAGTHIPLINSRLMMNAKNNSISMASSLNPYPRTTDYANPNKRMREKRKDADVRLSIGAVQLVNFSPYNRESDEVSETVLSSIYQGGDLKKLPKRERATTSKITDGKNKTLTKERDTITTRKEGPSKDARASNVEPKEKKEDKKKRIQPYPCWTGRKKMIPMMLTYIWRANR
ncbi:unnamed protein product [Arctia plantaginis]|uniref:Uncharacterized protein n=1 Tax=Arctia plantaginis TaxID=874455 RepID=A0A8S0ZF37_ARCPL|nr:unnamed protein product [Arctia plantaginis]